MTHCDKLQPYFENYYMEFLANQNPDQNNLKVFQQSSKLDIHQEQDDHPEILQKIVINC